MSHFSLHKYQDAALIAIASLLLIIITAMYVWAIGGLVGNFEKALTLPSGAETGAEFQTERAAKIFEGRGIGQ